MEARDLEVLLVYGQGGFHTAKMSYLTGYEPPFPTYFAFFADEGTDSTIFTGISNHVQYIKEASVIDDVRMMLPDPPMTVTGRLEEADMAGSRVGVVTDDPRYNLSIPHSHHQAFERELDATLVDVTAAYTRATAVCSEPELDRVRRAGEILDDVMRAAEDALAPGISESGLSDVMEETARDGGGMLGANFITSSPMEGAEPGEPITWHEPSERVVQSGDVVTTEISVNYEGYISQIHRPYVVGDTPNEQYQEMFDVCEAAYDRTLAALQPGNTAADVVEAMAPIESGDYKVYDVLLHGYGRSYRHPFVGIERSNYWPGGEDDLTAEWTFEPGMVMVIQPNVTTQDERACLQFGTTVIITDDGPEIVHDYPAEFLSV
jgi:Xaa-Pro aminopeptidase